MFHNSRKTIGVFLERSASEFQNRLCQGIITGAKEIGYNVAVFSDYGNLWTEPPLFYRRSDIVGTAALRRVRRCCFSA